MRWLPQKMLSREGKWARGQFGGSSFGLSPAGDARGAFCPEAQRRCPADAGIPPRSRPARLLRPPAGTGRTRRRCLARERLCERLNMHCRLSSQARLHWAPGRTGLRCGKRPEKRPPSEQRGVSTGSQATTIFISEAWLSLLLRRLGGAGVTKNGPPDQYLATLAGAASGCPGDFWSRASVGRGEEAREGARGSHRDRQGTG